ncbi:hypothetical protein [Muricoccus vinaceus]|uniref:Uncharacterized protein n=1 Tax=Muricoccus vinaceus TaxID=424704 RepID=A0ABV6IWV5_9PROT
MASSELKLIWVRDSGIVMVLHQLMTLTPDPHGQAALMLCEALALLLVERGTLLKSQVVEAIDGLIEVKQEIAGVSESVVVSIASIGLLRAIAQSVAAAAVPKPGLAS